MLRTKDEAFEKFKIFKVEVGNKLGNKIQWIRSDKGGAYWLNDYIQFCETHGIVREETTPHSPPENGVAEQKNRTLLEMVSAMLIHSKFLIVFWGEALYTSCHISSRIIHKNKKIKLNLLMNCGKFINQLLII